MRRYILILFLLILSSHYLKGQKGDTLHVNISNYYPNISGPMTHYKNEDWGIIGHQTAHLRLISEHGLLRIKDRKNCTYFNHTGKNLPTDTVCEMAVYRDTLIVATLKGLFFYNNSSFESWWPQNSIATTKFYSISVLGSEAYIGCSLGIYKISGSTVTNLNSMLGIAPVNNWLKVRRCPQYLYACIDTAAIGLNYATQNVKTYQLAKSKSWDAEAFDNKLLITMYGTDFPLKLIVNDSIYNFEDYFSRCQIRSNNNNIGDYSPLSSLVSIAKDDNKLHLCFNDQLGNLYTYMRLEKEDIFIRSGINLKSFYPRLAGVYKDTFCVNTDSIIIYCNEPAFEDAVYSVVKPKTMFEGDNVFFTAGANNFNSNLDFRSLVIKSENCLSTIAANSLWIGGYDSENQLHIAATTYLQQGNDFFPGPLKLNGTADSLTMQKFDKVWRVDLATIRNHQNEYSKNGVVAHVDETIATWPAYWVDGKDTLPLAPWMDVNKNGIYDPEHGDYPIIKGQKAAFYVMNDNGGIHSESQGKPLQIQVTTLVYAYDCENSTNDSLNVLLGNSVFVDYNITNFSNTAYKKMYASEWIDGDFGFYGDDKIGCLPDMNTSFIMNDDAYDEGMLGAGKNPGAQCIRLLEGPIAQDSDGIDNNNNDTIDEADEPCLLSNFMSYNHSPDPLCGDPSVAFQYYNFCRAHYRNGSPVRTYFDTIGDSVRFIFSNEHDPDHKSLQWEETGSSLIHSGDVLSISSSGPFDLKPGQTIPFHLAHFYVRNTNNSDQLPEIIRRTKQIEGVYKNGIDGCWMLNTQDHSKAQKMMSGTANIYPNPGNGSFTISTPIPVSEIRIYNSAGILCKKNYANTKGNIEVNITALPDDLYWITLSGAERTFSLKYVKISQ